jgi:aconitate hydratase
MARQSYSAARNRLLGVKVVIAQSFERIHRSNLVGMGVPPCQFRGGRTRRRSDWTAARSGPDSSGGCAPGRSPLEIHRADGRIESVPVIVRIDTPIEVDYYRHGGILPYVLRQLVA